MEIALAPIWLETVDSTQLELKRRRAQRPDLPPGTVLAARRQTAGRGRQGRSWVSGTNRNLCFSLLWPLAPDGPPAAAATLAAALAMDDLLQAHGIPSRPKWPNDVLVGERKICGILAEVLPGEPAALALGIGLNVNLEAEALAAIGRPATSMHLETDQVYDLPPLLAEALRALTPWLSRWARLGFAGLRVAWELRSQSLGQPIRIHRGTDLVQGRVGGYGPAGELLLETAPGRIQAIWSGEIVESGAGNSHFGCISVDADRGTGFQPVFHGQAAHATGATPYGPWQNENCESTAGAVNRTAAGDVHGSMDGP